MRRAELFLFERPILTIEHVGLGDRLEAADGFGVAYGFDPRLCNVGRDHGVTLRSTEPEQAETRHEHEAGQGIELLFDAAEAFIVVLEVLSIARHKCPNRVASHALEVIQLAGLRMRQNERPVLSADGVVRCYYATFAEAL